MSKQFTRHAAAAALVAACFWVISAIASTFGQGNLFTEWTQRNYAIWNALTAVAVLATIVVVAGVLLRGGGRPDGLAIAGLALAIIGGALMIVATWAWVATSLILAAAGLVVALRLRATGLGSTTDWLLAVAWPIGIVTFILLDQLKVGPTDSYGDYSVAAVTGFALAAVLFAISLTNLGSRLRAEEPADHLPDSAPV